MRPLVFESVISVTATSMSLYLAHFASCTSRFLTSAASVPTCHALVTCFRAFLLGACKPRGKFVQTSSLTLRPEFAISKIPMPACLGPETMSVTASRSRSFNSEHCHCSGVLQTPIPGLQVGCGNRPRSLTACRLQGQKGMRIQHSILLACTWMDEGPAINGNGIPLFIWY